MKRRKPQAQKNTLHNYKPLTLTIEDLSRSGAGVARDENGRVVFVPFTAPGDVVKVKLTKAKSKFAEGHVMEVIEPSSLRITPRCPVFGHCGGCQWQHIPYELQWKTKQEGVCNSLGLNHVALPAEIDEYPADAVWSYRNRIQLRGKGKDIGFYESKSHDLVAIQKCDIAADELNQAILATASEAEVKFNDEPYKVELSVEGGVVNKVWNAHHGAAGFRQVNEAQNANLQTWVKQHLAENIAILDLFGGGGNLSIPLIELASEIHCVDVNVPESSDHLPSYFHFHRSAVVPWLISFDVNKSLEWVALIDPPRDGLGESLDEIFDALDKLQVKQVVLVGCKVDPWARDIKRLEAMGWGIDHMAIFDFFPQTPHVETVALLSRREKQKKTGTKKRINRLKSKAPRKGV